MLRTALFMGLMALWSVSAQQGCNDLKKSVTHLRYYPIRDMRQTIAPDPQRDIWSSAGPVRWGQVPDSLSVPTIGADVYLSPGDVADKHFDVPPSTEASIAHGDSLFHTFCWTCHGKDLAGDGPVAPKLQAMGAVPTDLRGEAARGISDGMIYTFIRHGDGIMPSYGNQVSSHDAWTLVHYIRYMQKTAPR